MSLVAACLRGDVETLSDLLAAGEPLEARCEEGFTALYTAAAEDDPDAVRCLIEAGAVVSVGGSPQGATPLMVASENGHLECVRMLIEAGADLDMHVSCDAQPDFDPSAEDDPSAEWIPPPLVLAAGNGHQEVVRILIRAGADLNIKFGPCRNSPLHELCAAGRVQMARTLLDADADPSAQDVDGRSVLFVSCMCDQPECAALVLTAGAGIDQPMREPNPGATPLYVAAMCGNERRTHQRAGGARRHAHVCELPRGPPTRGHASLLVRTSENGEQLTRRADMFATDHGHDEVVRWLEASASYSPLHHVEVLTERRTVELLRGDACASYNLRSGRSIRPMRPRAPFRPPCAPPRTETPYELALARPDLPASQLILAAASPWSPASHRLWEPWYRERATVLCTIGYKLAYRLKREEHSFVDVWVSHVLAKAMAESV